MHLSFRRFLHLGNPGNQQKTEKLGNLATYVMFPRNPQDDELWETSETYGNLLTTVKII
ncbi:hypothetical protein K443DRAFT_682207 [Laccaria amethystina LaAM-08-1]|uniref:Uncharacterized protein n=1 Tax=Laccaria amethystina LaAM-08-1 TaxID=1095629 RepID=A0A0C9XKA2_9AGAR|nr:hypothetical protein K443DRAFT_682207 [Laccaria amethystina LaAM-08-1]